MYRIQWLSFIFFLTCFPGLILVLMRKVNFLRFTSDFFKYAICLGICDISTLLIIAHRYFVILNSILYVLVPFCCYFIEKSSLTHNVHLSIFNSKKAIIAILFYPLLEELNFRYNLFFICNVIGLQAWQFCLLSILTFVFSHIIYQGIVSLNKIIFATLITLIFLFTQNLFLVIGIHCLFNSLVFLDRSNQHQIYNL